MSEADDILAKIREKRQRKQLLEENPLMENKPLAMEEAEVDECPEQDEAMAILDEIRKRKRADEHTAHISAHTHDHNHCVTMPAHSHGTWHTTTVVSNGDNRFEEMQARLNKLLSAYEEDKYELKSEIAELRKEICLLRSEIVDARNSKFRDECCKEVSPGIMTAPKGDAVAVDIEVRTEDAYARAMKVLD